MNQVKTINKPLPRRPPRRPLDLVRGSLFILVWFLGFVFVGFMLVGFAFASLFYGSSVGLILVGILGISLAFFSGLMLKKGGWIMGLCLASVFLFMALPWMLYGKYSAYIWTVGSDFDMGYFAAALIIPTSVLLGYCASAIAESRGRRTPELERPYLSFVPLVALCLIFSIAVPFILEYTSTSPGETLKLDKYHFQVEVPRGWSVEDKKNLISRVYGEDSGALDLFEVDYEKYNESRECAYERNTSTFMRILVYKVIPYTNFPLSSAESKSDCYKQIDDALRVLSSNVSDRSMPKQVPIEVSNEEGVEYVYRDFDDALGFRGDIFVYHSGYLYQFDIQVGIDSGKGLEIFNQMLSMFSFI